MSRTMTEVGRFIRDIVTTTPALKNREVASRVVQHFPGQEFEVKALRQRVANFRFQLNKHTTPTTTEGNNAS
ncbi:hypothetical protein LCGC14_1915780 [marine sediment metagenome]|uniref:Uncharacterized protein n=1 Tax=marine sediment metagenome TaxID=412755 RepID=A0A0F9FS36_9ZZZZ